MSAPDRILDKDCRMWWKFDIVITKIILLVFLLETRCRPIIALFRVSITKTSITK